MLSSCQTAPTELERPGAPDASEGVAYVYGHPVGVTPLPPVSGNYPPEVTNDPEALRAQVAYPAVGLELTNLAATAPSWEEAHERLQSFLASPPEIADDVPRHILEQTAALSMYHMTDLLAGAPSSRRDEVIETYLSYAVENRTPSPPMVEDMLNTLGETVPADQKRSAAQAAIEAFEAHEERTALCDGCILAGSDSPQALRKAARDARALRALGALASAE